MSRFWNQYHVVSLIQHCQALVLPVLCPLYILARSQPMSCQVLHSHSAYFTVIHHDCYVHNYMAVVVTATASGTPDVSLACWTLGMCTSLTHRVPLDCRRRYTQQKNKIRSIDQSIDDNNKYYNNNNEKIHSEEAEHEQHQSVLIDNDNNLYHRTIAVTVIDPAPQINFRFQFWKDTAVQTTNCMVVYFVSLHDTGHLMPWFLAIGQIMSTWHCPHSANKPRSTTAYTFWALSCSHGEHDASVKFTFPEWRSLMYASYELSPWLQDKVQKAAHKI